MAGEFTDYLEADDWKNAAAIVGLTMHQIIFCIWKMYILIVSKNIFLI